MFDIEKQLVKVWNELLKWLSSLKKKYNTIIWKLTTKTAGWNYPSLIWTDCMGKWWLQNRYNFKHSCALRFFLQEEIVLCNKSYVHQCHHIWWLTLLCTARRRKQYFYSQTNLCLNYAGKLKKSLVLSNFHCKE